MLSGSGQSLDALQGDLVEFKRKRGFLEVTYSIGTCHFEGMEQFLMLKIINGGYGIEITDHLVLQLKDGFSFMQRMDLI